MVTSKPKIRTVAFITLKSTYKSSETKHLQSGIQVSAEWSFA